MGKYGIRLLPKLAFENTYAIGMLAETAEKYSLDTINDLAEVSDEIAFGAKHGFYTEEESITYTSFINLKYSAIEIRNIEVTTVYTTAIMSRKIRLVILKDDKDFFS